jgi:predicted RNase H-like HicB family nuclease
MTRYFAILEKQPGSLWGVYFPDLPGCVSAAETAEQAIENAEAALTEVAEDMVAEGVPLPNARSVEDLRANIEVREALASGAALVAVPLRLAEAAE